MGKSLLHLMMRINRLRHNLHRRLFKHPYLLTNLAIRDIINRDMDNRGITRDITRDMVNNTEECMEADIHLKEWDMDNLCMDNQCMDSLCMDNPCMDNNQCMDNKAVDVLEGVEWVEWECLLLLVLEVVWSVDLLVPVLSMEWTIMNIRTDIKMVFIPLTALRIGANADNGGGDYGGDMGGGDMGGGDF
jgi:hypothetical protein